LTGNFHTRARTVKREAVIPTNQAIAHDRAERQGVSPMRALISESHHLPGFAAKQRDELAKDLARKGLGLELGAESCHVPMFS
jgi:hypothetical protein